MNNNDSLNVILIISLFIQMIFLLPINGQYIQIGGKLVGSGNISAACQGRSVSVSGDGLTAISGGNRDNSNRGAFWIFTLSSITQQWKQQGGKFIANDYIDTSSMGTSSSISYDGNVTVIGGETDNVSIGAAWVFTRVGGVWNQKGSKLVGTGYSGTQVYQGHSVSISSDASTIVVGGYYDNSQVGAIWIYSLSNGNYSQIGNKLVGTGAADASRQGSSVSISFDGSTIASGGHIDGANDEGAVWIFTKNGNAWIQQNTKLIHPSASSYTYLGSSVALSSDGNTLVAGGNFDNNYIGAMFIFSRSAGVWASQSGKYVGSGYAGQPRQGSSVSISSDGNIVAVGGYGDNTNIGATWIWTRSYNGIWSQYGSKIVGSSIVGSSQQGISVSLSSNGTTLFVGGYGDDSSLGAAWIFFNPLFANSASPCQRPSNSSSTIYSTTCPISIINGSSCSGVCANGYSLTSGSLSVTCDNGTLSTATGFLFIYFFIFLIFLKSYNNFFFYNFF
jgi:hypothetical protein